MLKTSPAMKLLQVALTSTASTLASLALAASGPAVPNEILVEVKPHMSEQAIQTLLEVHGAQEVDSIPELNVRVLRVPEAKRDHVLEALQHNPNIQFAEVNGVAAAGALTNDPYVTNGYEWHVSKIQLAQAWGVTSANPGTVVAIVDTGVAANHPDLTGKVLAGYNFYANNADTSDDYGHGTAVAGTAAAQGNNGAGVAGVAWNASILPVKISDPTGYATYSNMAKALTYAVDHGARVINISFYGSTSSSTLQSAADYVWNHNGVIFACAGNTGTNAAQYPAACNNVVAVSNTTSSDTLSTTSTYGSFIDISAPGSGIWTTNRDGTYGAWSGTSFASPIAAGVATLLVANDPSISNARIVDILKQNSDDLGTAGYDTSFGYGRVNAYRALVAAGASAPADTTAPTTAITSPSASSTIAGTVTVQASASDSVGVTKVELYLDGALAATASSAPASFAWDTKGVANGTHILRSVAYDAAGNAGNSADVSVNVQNVVLVADSTLPTALITSPTAGTVVSRTLKVYTQTTDNVGVARVELYADGAIAATSTATSPTFSLNTGKWTKGTHTLQVIAYDAAGNAGASAGVAVAK